MEVLEFQLPEQSLDEVYIFFPDPWPKKKHHKRRLVNNAFLSLLLPKLKAHARLFISTDWQELGEYMRQTCDNHPNFMNLAGQSHFAPRPIWRPVTKFEQRGKKLNHRTWDMVYCKAY